MKRDLASLGDVGKPSAADELKRNIFIFKSSQLTGQMRNHFDVVQGLI